MPHVPLSDSLIDQFRSLAPRYDAWQAGSVRTARAGVRPFDVRVSDSGANLIIFSEIDSWYGVSAAQIAQELNQLRGQASINVHINSPGGDVFQSFAIYSLLRETGAQINVYIYALAASGASIIAMAGDVIKISSTGRMMIHEARGTVRMQTATEMRQAADFMDGLNQDLKRVYANRSGLEASVIEEMMKTDYYMTAKQAIEKGFADEEFADLDITNYLPPDPTPTEMKLVTTALGLPEGTTDGAAAQAVERMKQELQEAKALQAKFGAAVKVLAAKAGMSDAEQLEAVGKFAQLDPEAAAKMVPSAKGQGESVPTIKELVDAVRAGQAPSAGGGQDRSSWTFLDYLQKDAQALKAMRSQDPATYAALYKKTYGVAPDLGDEVHSGRDRQ